MSSDRVFRSALALTIAALAACRAGEPAKDAAAGGTNEVTVTARDYAFDAPATVPAGLTTFHLVNKGPSLHHLQLIKLDEGKTGDDYVAALKAGGPPPPWASLAGGPNPPEPGSTTTATVSLEPGDYAIVCFVPGADGMPHLMKGMVHPVKVVGPSRAGAEPAADIVMKLVDFDFQLSAALPAGRHTIRVENAGSQPHEVAIIRMQPGRTPEDFAAWAEKMSGPAPGALFGGMTGIMPGAHAFAIVDLPAGDYALMCFFPDGKDGKPHFAHGMMKMIKVS
ncbi:MAG TPA: hypothetical protein VIE46_09480 [Gemmatimonadales bacterium]|jgi:uncharacterized cupredoxin-like copper-binding protein